MRGDAALTTEAVDSIALPDQRDPVTSALQGAVLAVDRVPLVHEGVDLVAPSTGPLAGFLADGAARAHGLKVAIEGDAGAYVSRGELSLIALDQFMDGVLAGRRGAVLTGRASDLRVDGRTTAGQASDPSGKATSEDDPSVHDVTSMMGEKWVTDGILCPITHALSKKSL